MNCDTAQTLLSARLDSELVGDEPVLLEVHLAGCADCRAHADQLAGLHRRVRIQRIDHVPDLVDAVTARVRPAHAGRGSWIRLSLGWVAVVLLAQNLGALVLGRSEGVETHMARHLGAFGVALAVGFAYAAWRPHRAFGLLPFTFALVGAVLGSALIDFVEGDRAALAELVHVSELAGLWLLWLLSGSPGWHPERWRRSDRPARPTTAR